MVTLLLSIILASTVIITIFLLHLQYRHSFVRDKASTASILLSLWLIASVFFGAAFYIIPIPFVIDVTIERILFSIIILLTFFGFVKGLQQRLFHNYSFELLMGLFVLICIISMLQHGFFPERPEFSSPWFVFITGYFFPFITFFFAKYYLSSTADIRLIFSILFYIGAYMAIMSFFEFYQIDQLIFPRYVANPDIGIHYGQARGPFLNSPHMGMAVLFSLACGLHLISYRLGMGKLIFSLLLFLYPFAVFFSQTRAVYLAFVFMLVIYLFLYHTHFPKWKVVALPVFTVILAILALTPILAREDRRAGGLYQVETVTIRQGLTQMSFLMIKDHPLTGVGLTQFVPAMLEKYRGRVPILDIYQDATYFHNHLLGMATELGLTGVLVYLSIIILMFKRLFALSRYLSSSDQFINTNILVVIGAIWTGFLVNFSFASPEFEIFTNSVVFIFAGIVDGLYQKYRQEEPSPVPQADLSRLEYQKTPA
jgi:O-antigen ligase